MNKKNENGGKENKKLLQRFIHSVLFAKVKKLCFEDIAELRKVQISHIYG